MNNKLIYDQVQMWKSKFLYSVTKKFPPYRMLQKSAK
jgi:hypothetical protein